MTQHEPRSISRLIDQVKHDDPVAEFGLWDRMITDAIHVARRQLQRLGAKRRVVDEEDVAGQALFNVLAGARGGKYPNLVDRQGLARLLNEIIKRRAINVKRDENIAKRGGGRVRGESVFDAEGDRSAHMGLQQFAERTSDPAELNELVRLVRNQFDSLDDSMLELVILKYSGFTNVEVAQHLEMSLATAERRIQDVRMVWERQSLQNLLSAIRSGDIARKELLPCESDCESILTTTHDIEIVVGHAQSSFDSIAERFSPIDDNADYNAVTVTTAELRSDRKHSFPHGYTACVPRLQRGVRLWGVVKKGDSTACDLIHSIIHSGRRWIFLPDLDAVLTSESSA